MMTKDERAKEAYRILHTGGEAALAEVYGAEIAKLTIDKFVELGMAKWVTVYTFEERAPRWDGDNRQPLKVGHPELKTYTKYTK